MDNIIRWTGRTLAAVVLTFGVACGHPSTTCTKNSDCAGNLVCTNGACVDPCLSLNPADTTPTLCSQSGTVGAKITFVNNCTTLTVKLIWIDYQCVEKPYPTLAPGQSVVVDSYVTHPWRIRDSANGKLLKEVPPRTNGTPSTVTVP
jgi:hypothetical protein